MSFKLFFRSVFSIGAFFFFVALPSMASAATYYIDPAGNDTNNGTSQATAWKTLTKVKNATFKPGDSVLFKRGGVWHGSFSIKSPGSAGNPIYYGAYGSGAKPTFHGDGLVSSVIEIQNTASY